MTALDVRDLEGDYPFGARIAGITRSALADEDVRAQIQQIFEDRGLIIFEDVEASTEMQLALSNVIGPLQDHAIEGVRRVDADAMPGVIDIEYKANLYEIDGRIVEGWLPWHFDACYTRELNRGALLRPITIPSAGGMTGFADGVQMYSAVSAETRARCDDLRIVYDESLMLGRMRFGLPPGFRVVSLNEVWDTVLRNSVGKKRAVHPAVWTRRSGEKVLHLAPWQAFGIFGVDEAEGAALFAEIWDEVLAKMTPYLHRWKPTEMVAWDNWRLLHSVSGHDPREDRHMHRTTIKGDYGLGCLEDELLAADEQESTRCEARSVRLI